MENSFVIHSKSVWSNILKRFKNNQFILLNENLKGRGCINKVQGEFAEITLLFGLKKNEKNNLLFGQTNIFFSVSTDTKVLENEIIANVLPNEWKRDILDVLTEFKFLFEIVQDKYTLNSIVIDDAKMHAVNTDRRHFKIATCLAIESAFFPYKNS